MEIDYKTRYERLVALCRFLIKDRADAEDLPEPETRIRRALRAWDELEPPK